MANTANMMTIHVKLMNGDFVEIHHRLRDHEDAEDYGYSHLDEFVRKVYDACPAIPFGCLVLHRMNDDDMSAFLDIETEVSFVVDGDELCAFVDPSRVEPKVSVKNARVIVDQTETNGSKLSIEFCETHGEQDDDGNVYPIYVVDVLCANGQYALAKTFERVHRFYTSTESTRWFSTIDECLKSEEFPRYPTDSNTIEKITDGFRRSAFTIDGRSKKKRSRVEHEW